MDSNRHQGAGICKDVLLHTSFLVIILLCSAADSLTVKVPASRITAIRGLSVVLGCEFSPIFGQNPDLSSLVVTWQRREDNRVVHSYYYVQDQLDKQNPAYRNRTELFVTELSKGNASVRINNVQMQDGGRYICTVSTSQGTDQAELQLDYGAFYTGPRLSVNIQHSEVVMQYEMEGFPQAEVMWKGEHGTNLSDCIKTLMQEMGLYYITCSFTAPNAPFNVSFILQNPLLHQYLQMPISYSGKYQSCVIEDVAIAVLTILLIVAGAVLIWNLRRKLWKG